MIDSNARAILATDDFEELSLSLVRDIIIRDSLSVRDEGLVCDALHRLENCSGSNVRS